MSLGKRLSQLRKSKELTQEQASKLLNISRSRIALYETDKRDIDTETLRQLAEFYGVTTDYLLDYKPLTVNIKTDFENLTSVQRDIIFDKIYNTYADEELLNKYIDQINTSSMKESDIRKLVSILKITNPQDQARILTTIVDSLDIEKDGAIFAHFNENTGEGIQESPGIYLGNSPIKSDPIPPQLSPDELVLIEKYRRMKNDEKDIIHKIANYISPDD